MNGALDILKRERDDAAEQIRMLRVRIRDLEAAIGVLEGHPVPAKASRSLGELKQSVMAEIGSFGADGATPKEIADALTQQGRTTSDASVSSTLSRLKGDSRVTNRNGRWFAASPADVKQGRHAAHSGQNGWDDLDDESPF